MNINYQKLGDRIRTYRLMNKLSQEELAEAADLSNVHISNIENGNKNPSIDVIASIAAALNVTPDQLLADSLPQNKNDLNSLLLDCNPEEVSILVDSFTGLKEILSKYQIKK